MRFQQLQDWLEWQESCHPSEIELGLDRVGRVARAMAISLDNCQVVTVAGTNGKGSCVATLNALLLSAGYSVGCYTSPHFIDYNERVVLNGAPISDQPLMEAFQRIDEARGDIALTYFEFGTLAALDIFERSPVDVVLLEVGLGGRLDAVNIIDADIAVVTSIDIDHQDWLGSDREQIGREKAGIFRPGKPAISAGLNPPSSLRVTADDVSADFLQAGDSYHFTEGSWSGVNRHGEAIVLSELPEFHLPEESMAAAIQALYLLDLSLEHIDFNCLESIQLPGRFQQIQLAGRSLILDVAHNPAAASYLSSRLKHQSCTGKTYAVMSVMKDKDLDGIVSALDGDVEHWSIADQPDNQRAMSASDIGACLVRHHITDYQLSDNIPQACQSVLALMAEADRLVVFGSFFTVAEVLTLVEASDTL